MGEKRNPMVRVTLADVQEIHQGRGTVTLREEVGNREVVLRMGRPESRVISLCTGNSIERPMTFDFIVNLLVMLGATLEEVRIQVLKDNIFYSILKVRSGNAVRELEARPSDSLPLALLTKSPIFVAEEILAQKSWKDE